MRWKNYKPGDRIFYKAYDGEIHSDIVLKVEELTYEENGCGQPYTVHYQELYVSELMVIENYNCLPQNSPEVKELLKKYKSYDKIKEKLVPDILDKLSLFSKNIQREFVSELIAKFGLSPSEF